MNRPRRLMSEALTAAAQLHPEKEAVVTRDERLTYAELLEQATAFAALLQTSGVERGERVALFMDNTARTVACIYGTWLAGAAVVVINPQTKTDKLEYVLRDCKAAFLVADAQLRRTYAPATADLP